MRFVDEDRDDEWTQLALTLQGDLGWAQFTSATSYFTRDISYFQDNTDYTFYLSGFGNPAQRAPASRPRTTAPIRSARIRSASAGATGTMRTAWPRSSGSRARRRR